MGCSGGPALKLWSPERAHISSGQEESRSWPCWHGRLRPTYVNWGYFWPLAWLWFGDAEQLLVPSLSTPLSQGPAGGSKTVPTPGVNSGCSWVCRFWGRIFGVTSWSRLEMVLSSLPASLPVSLPARAFLAAVLGGSHPGSLLPSVLGFLIPPSVRAEKAPLKPHLQSLQLVWVDVGISSPPSPPLERGRVPSSDAH